MKITHKTTQHLTIKALILACTVVLPFLSGTTLAAAEYTYPTGGTVTDQSHNWQPISGTYSNPEGTELKFTGWKQLGGEVTLSGEGSKVWDTNSIDGTSPNNKPIGSIIIQDSGSVTFNGQINGSVQGISIGGTGNVSFNSTVGAKSITYQGAGDVTFNGVVNTSVSTLSIGGTGNVSFNSTVAATTISISGEGETVFGETSDFSWGSVQSLNISGPGITIINSATRDVVIANINISDGGTLVLNTSEESAVKRSNITVSDTGTLILASDNQFQKNQGESIRLEDGARLVLSGTNQTIASLHVVGTAIIDMGIGAPISTVTINELKGDGKILLVGYDPETMGDTINLNGRAYSYDNLPANVVIDNGNAIPEPSTYAAFGGALLLGLVMLRRRKN